MHFDQKNRYENRKLRGKATNWFFRGPEILTLLSIVVTVIWVNILYIPRDFADNSTYIILIDAIYNNRIDSWYSFEPAISGIFFLLRELTGNAETAADLAHYGLAGFFIVATIGIAYRSKCDWRALAIFFALYGPLLAFATIRATPAYFLVTWAAIEAREGKFRSILIALAALLFHISIVLALPPLFICFVQNRFRMFAWLSNGKKEILIAGVMFGGGFVVFRDLLSIRILEVVDQFAPFIGKYMAYLAALDQSAQNTSLQTTSSQYFHTAYAIVVLAFALTVLLLTEERYKSLRSYIITSCIIFLFLQFSPVGAFRQSIYWIMPAVFLFPWAQFGRGPLRSAVLIMAVIAIFLVNMRDIVT